MAGRAVGKLNLSREEMKEIFREHDVDGDGNLNINELVKAFGFCGHVIPFYKAHYGLAFADDNCDGLVSEDELEKLVDYAKRFEHKKH